MGSSETSSAGRPRSLRRTAKTSPPPSSSEGRAGRPSPARAAGGGPPAGGPPPGGGGGGPRGAGAPPLPFFHFLEDDGLPRFFRLLPDLPGGKAGRLRL